MKKKLPIIAALSGAAIAIGYRAIKGHGVFNRIRFSDEHSAVARYVEQNHPGATYSSIHPVGESFTTIIDDGERKFLLTVTPTDEGVYVYKEENLTFMA